MRIWRFLRARDIFYTFMSAFVGLLNLNGQVCDPEIVGAMLTRLHHRVDKAGAAAARVRCRGPFGVGNAALLSTPQARQEIERPDEAQTLTRDGLTLWIGSDARLDNREELVEVLKLDAQAGRLWSDGRLVLEAFGRWKEDAPLHLRGDFAFVVWDQARQRLFCARDRFGTKPFYYAHQPGQFFAFASEIKALWFVPGLEKVVNDAQIADYLLARAESVTSTFYQNVRRLSPAHRMWVAPEWKGDLREDCYWKLNPQRDLMLRSDGDYAQMMREKFFDSVRERTRSEGRFSVFLSGGLDSSSVAAVAERVAQPSQKPVPALSRVFDRFPQCDEREFIQITLNRGEFEPIWNLSDDITALTDIENILWHLDQPSHGPNACSAWAQYKVLQNAGVHVVLNGHGGDEVVWTGYGRIIELLNEGNFLTAWREMRLLRQRKLMSNSGAPLMWNALLRHARSKRGLGRLLSLQRRRQKRRPPSATRNRKDTDRNSPHALINPQLASNVPPVSVRSSHSVRQEHFKALESPVQPAAMEILDAMAGAHAIESRCPFWEQRLVETCLAFPAEQKMKNGFNRYVMRQAMEGLLAPQVQWRPDKTDFSPQVLQSLQIVEREHVDQLLHLWETSTSLVAAYVQMEEVRRLWLEVQNQSPDHAKPMFAASGLWKTLSLGLWLSQQSQK